ncbi:MAG: Gfo/Idh/MocA family oxidoreductase [Verrucomicrobiota bacterium]
MKKIRHSPTRRSFIKKSAAASFGFSVLPSYLALGKPDGQGNVPPSGRINLGCVGVGGRARSVVPGVCKDGFAKPVALCDVDFKARNVETNLEQYPDAKQFADFRVMLDKMGDDIDAVTVVTPDHTHFVAAIDAMRRGKHVYVEKPLTHSYREADLLMQAEKKYGVVTQMGNQGHTSSGSEQFRNLVDKNIIRDIVKIDAWKSGGLWFMDAAERIKEYPAEEEKPSTLDWDLWCGPAEMKPFSSLYHPFSWRGFHLYGNGMLGDWGAHIIDFAHDFLNLGLPTKIQALEMADHNQIIFPLVSKLSMHFPARGDGMPACDLIWHDSSDDCAPKADEKYWDGDDAPDFGKVGTLLHRADGEFLVQRGSHSRVSRIYPREEMMKYAEDIKVPGPEFGHAESFTQACLGNGTTSSPFSIAAPLTKVLLLGVVAQYLNEDLDFDPETESFKNNDAANDHLAGPPPRTGWKDFYNDI